MDTNIKIGDKVSFHFSSGQKVSGNVIGIPSDYCPLWEIQSFYKGKPSLVTYVKNYDYMLLYPKGGANG